MHQSNLRKSLAKKWVLNKEVFSKWATDLVFLILIGRLFQSLGAEAIS